MKLSDSVEALRGVGGRRAALYRKLGISSIYDLLTFYPRDYLDLSHPVSIREAPLQEPAAIRARVCRKQGEQRIRKGLSLFRVYVTDEETNLTITIFNSQFQFDSLEEGKEYYFYGKITGTLLRREMNSPLIIPAEEQALIRPVYSLTEGLSNKLVQGNVKEALEVWGDRLSDPIPFDLRQREKLCQLRYAIENIHFPENAEALRLARERLIFEELLVLQLGMFLLRRKNRRETGIRLQDTDLSAFLESLPFELTEGQSAAIADSLADMTRPVPMNRLVQGDVGSGKTMVAAALCYVCHQNVYQAAVMAPTQILADQHFAAFSRQLEPLGVKCGLLTGSQTAKQRKALLEEVREGRISVVIGTHALVQEDVAFASLGLVVTDEQHRFGVAQRAALASKGHDPHLLVMSATPIPRTLALMIYGDLDVSVIRELPKGRKPVQTKAIPSEKRPRALGFLKKQLEEGRQAYIVCPLIEEGENELVSAAAYLEQLQRTPLAEYPMAVLHGRLKPKEKDRLMSAFQSGEIRILIATTVVEVGVDVPNANVMLIENAERFGLSQLHQLRGRVGRGSWQSYCILISDHEGEENRKRLEIMTETSDGFRIAEEDLKLRGPGDFFGFRQHGLPTLKVANLVEDLAVLRRAQQIAEELLAEDEGLSQPEHRGLRVMVRRLFARNEQTALN